MIFSCPTLRNEYEIAFSVSLKFVSCIARFGHAHAEPDRGEPNRIDLCIALIYQIQESISRATTILIDGVKLLRSVWQIHTSRPGDAQGTELFKSCINIYIQGIIALLDREIVQSLTLLEQAEKISSNKDFLINFYFFSEFVRHRPLPQLMHDYLLRKFVCSS